jgi:chromosome segregation ATPase
MDIEELGLSVRAYNGVKRYGINTTEELAERIDEFCKHAPKFGAEAREALSKVSAPQPSGVIVESAEYTRAVKLHRCICANAQAAQESLYEMCKALKEMHDNKLYKELGYNSFESYTEAEVGIKRHQAQKYLSVAELENGDTYHHLGLSKLSLLAKLDEQERAEIVQNTDLESTSVRELKAKISELERDLKTQQDNYSMHTKRREDEIAKLQSSNAMLQDNIVNEQNKSIQLQSQLDSMTADRDQEKEWREELVAENGKQSDRISELIAQVDELENRPVDVLIHNNDEEIDRLTAQFQEELKKRDKDTEQRLEQQREKYLKQMNEGIAKAKEEAQAPDLHELWRALDNSLDNAIEAIEDFFDDYEDHPKIKDFASCLKTTIRDLNKLMNDVLAGEK